VKEERNCEGCIGSGERRVVTTMGLCAATKPQGNKGLVNRKG